VGSAHVDGKKNRPLEVACYSHPQIQHCGCRGGSALGRATSVRCVAGLDDEVWTHAHSLYVHRVSQRKIYYSALISA